MRWINIFDECQNMKTSSCHSICCIVNFIFQKPQISLVPLHLTTTTKTPRWSQLTNMKHVLLLMTRTLELAPLKHHNTVWYWQFQVYNASVGLMLCGHQLNSTRTTLASQHKETGTYSILLIRAWCSELCVATSQHVVWSWTSFKLIHQAEHYREPTQTQAYKGFFLHTLYYMKFYLEKAAAG